MFSDRGQPAVYVLNKDQEKKQVIQLKNSRFEKAIIEKLKSVPRPGQRQLHFNVRHKVAD